jgi:hypothetical protein
VSGDLLHACTRCRSPRLLLGHVTDQDRLCADCYREAGEPPAGRMSPAGVHAAELAARDRMLARGGTDRHLVRSGKS